MIRYAESAEAEPLVGTDTSPFRLVMAALVGFPFRCQSQVASFEAAGQALNELSIWRDGKWLVERSMASKH